ncbi:oligosaccharide flippase family protein [Halococcus sediminicola]|uniref:oligosaccharide flippase family protein n=1 Tax=Halococcus sediminicola TaxID=1264579 RepID=UPI0006784753|nr:oligosaccharide flippase family protein [Halococcus sediminicola]
MTDETDSGVPAALRSVARGAGAQALGLGTSRVLGFVTTFLLTTSLGASLYGIFSFSKTLISIAGTITNLGTDQSIYRFIPEYEDQETRNRVLGLATLTSFVGSVVVGLTLYFSAPVLTELTLDQPLLTNALRLFAIALPFMTLTGCIASVFRGLELPGYQIMTGSVGRQVFRLVTVGIVVAVGATLVGIVAAAVVAWVLAFLFGVGLLTRRTNFWPSLSGSQPSVRRFYNYSVPLTMGDIGRMVQNKVDILMVGVFLPGAAVGIYNLSTVLTQALTVPSIALNTIYPPIAARMYSNDEIDDLESLFTQVTRWSFTLSLLPAIGLIAYSEQLLAVFGEGFGRGEMVLVLFAVGYFADAANGPTNYTLMMTDHQYLLMIDRWTVGISNAVLNFIFINRYGLIGAAFATGLILTTISIVRLVEIWYTEGLVPYSWKFLKPITAGAACGVVLTGLEVLSPLTGIALMVVGGLIGTATYVLILVALGIEPEDREFFADVGSRLT